METRPLRFIAFHGISWMSKVIKFYTRSEISHIACVDMQSGNLIEAWNHNGGIQTWWDYSGFDAHTPGTEYDVWELNLSAEDAVFCGLCYQSFANHRRPYDWPGVMAFGLRMVRPSKAGLFCSEGALLPLASCLGWQLIRPDHVSPVTFCMLIEAMGGRIVEKGIVQKGKAPKKQGP